MFGDGIQTALVRSLYVDNINRTDIKPTIGTARQLLRSVPVAGSARAPGSLAIEHSTNALGDVLVYVARGGLEVDLDGVIHALEEGDALMFDGGVPHRFRRTGGTSTRALKVATPA